MTLSISDATKGERRRGARVTPDPLLTITLPSGNQGIVLDVSHEGVGFLASLPVEEAATIRFEIAARSARGSGGSGQLVWKDDSGKRGGLRFAEVSEELRAVLTQLLPLEKTQAPKKLKKKVHSVHSSPTKKSETNAETERRILGSDDIPDMPDFGRKSVASAAAYPADTRGQRVYSNAVTIGAACLFAIAIWYCMYSSKGRTEALNLYSHLKHPVSVFASEQINRLKNGWTPQVPSGPVQAASQPANTAVLPKPALTPPAPVPSPVAQAPLKTESNPAPAAATLAPVVEKKDARPGLQLLSSVTPQASQPAPSSASVQSKDTSQDRDSVQPQFAAAQKLLQDDSDGSNASKAAQLLWQAVEKGNSAASIDLADLYLTGRGVAKSCNQAVVLLTAAENHHNALAKSKLQDLDQYGCGANANSATKQESARASDSENLTR